MWSQKPGGEPREGGTHGLSRAELETGSGGSPVGSEVIKVNKVTQEGVEFKERPRGHQGHKGDRGGPIRER